MADSKMRTLELVGTKRTGIRLDSATWLAVDWLAERQGKKWAEWAREIAENNPGADNMTAVIREAAMNGILTETILAKRETLQGSLADEHPMLLASAIMDDDELIEHMGNSEIQGSEDFVGFTLHAGIDEFQRPCIWIENNVKGCPSVALPMPGSGK